jgi:hypothetical protein
MKSLRTIALVAALLLAFAGIVSARFIHFWRYQELLDKSDLVVIATAGSTDDTNEHIDLPGFVGEHVIGVDTKFAVSAVLKGDKSQTNIVFHHYRTLDGAPIGTRPNFPTYVSFAPAEKGASFPQSYILFLVREAGSRYAPVVGQTDPGMAVNKLVGFPSFPSGQERGLEFLSNIPELRDLSLSMSEDQLQSHIEKHGLYSTKTLQKGRQKDRVSYWVLTPGGENVFVAFEGNKCMGIQRMQPIPQQRIENQIGSSEYRAWMAKLKAESDGAVNRSQPNRTHTNH